MTTIHHLWILLVIHCVFGELHFVFQVVVLFLWFWTILL